MVLNNETEKIYSDLNIYYCASVSIHVAIVIETII